MGQNSRFFGYFGGISHEIACFGGQFGTFVGTLCEMCGFQEVLLGNKAKSSGFFRKVGPTNWI